MLHDVAERERVQPANEFKVTVVDVVVVVVVVVAVSAAVVDDVVVDVLKGVDVVEEAERLRKSAAFKRLFSWSF